MSDPVTNASKSADSPIGPVGVSAKLIDTVEVALEAYLGGARMSVGALTALEPGAVVTLDAALGRQVELRLNGVTVALGELVAVGESFGVRLVEIVEWPQ